MKELNQFLTVFSFILRLFIVTAAEGKTKTDQGNSYSHILQKGVSMAKSALKTLFERS